MSKDECPAEDRLIIGPDLGDGSHSCVRHTPDHKIHVGRVQPLRDGQSIIGDQEILMVKYDSQQGDFLVRTVYNPRHQGEESNTSKGPAKVTSDAYRAGYDRIFGKTSIGTA